MLPDLVEIFLRQAQQRVGVGVGADALQTGQFGLEQVEQFEHPALGDGESVAVGEEDPVHVRACSPRGGSGRPR